MSNVKVISVSIFPEQHEQLKKEKKVKKVPVSEIIREIVSDYLKGATISIDENLQEVVESYCQDKGVGIQEFINELIKENLDKDEKNKNCYPITLRIPTELRGNRTQLANWLQTRAKYILDKLS